MRLEKLLQEVSECHFWGAMRLAAATLKKIYPSVSHVTTILVEGCQVNVTECPLEFDLSYQFLLHLADETCYAKILLCCWFGASEFEIPK